MSKKLFLSTICLCLGLLAKAEDTDISQYENVVFPVSTTGSAGSTVTVSVEMNNTVNVSAFQFNIILPDGFTVPKDDDDYLIELSGTRTTTARHSISSALQSDGSIKVLCGSQQSKTFSGSSGEVCTITLNIGGNLADGNYPIIFKDIRISDAEAHVYKVEQVEATLAIQNYLVGDANGDGQVLVGDVTALLNYIVGRIVSSFNEKAADVNGDGVILVGDVTALLNIIVNRPTQ